MKRIMTPEQKYFYLKHCLGEMYGWYSNLEFVHNHPDHPTSSAYLKKQLDPAILIPESMDAIKIMLAETEDDSICHASCKLGMYWCSLKKGHKENHSMRGWLTWDDNFCDKWDEL